VEAEALAPPVDPEAFSFVVAGHAYGAHEGDNLGLLPRFLAALAPRPDDDFLVLTGDFVREGTDAGYATVLEELAALEKPYYLVLGNHDDTPRGREVLGERYGGTWYWFAVGPNLFVVLDSQRRPYSFDEDQMAFLEDRLAENPWRNVFVFFHEVLWLGSERYDGLEANFGDDPRYRQTSFWTEVFPLCERYPDIEFHVLAGDVGGRPGAMPAFFDRVGNVTLVASGMGEVEDENFLRVQVSRGAVTMTAVPLQAGKPVRPVEWFNPYNLRHRLAGQCVHPGCVLPRGPEPPGAPAEAGLWDRLLQTLGIR
jgi:hypothetical protein